MSFSNEAEGADRSSTPVKRRPSILEVVALLVLLALVAGAVLWAVSNRRKNEQTAREVTETRLTLVRAAEAVESYAAGQDGFYDGAEGTNTEDLASNPYEPPRGIRVVVESAAAETYCLQATNTALVAHPWRTATYISSDQTVSAADECDD